MGHREAYGLRLVGDDIHLLEAGGRGVDREEGQAVAGAVDAGALDDERFGVLLVFDLADIGGAVGVEEAVALQVVGVEAGACNAEAEAIVGVLASFEGGGSHAG